MKPRNQWLRKPRSARFMSLFIFIGILAVAAISATLPDIPTDVDYNNLRGAAKFQGVETLKVRE
jgi:hypothetical protein